MSETRWSPDGSWGAGVGLATTWLRAPAWRGSRQARPLRTCPIRAVVRQPSSTPFTRTNAETIGAERIGSAGGVQQWVHAQHERVHPGPADDLYGRGQAVLRLAARHSESRDADGVEGVGEAGQPGSQREVADAHGRRHHRLSGRENDVDAPHQLRESLAVALSRLEARLVLAVGDLHAAVELLG